MSDDATGSYVCSVCGETEDGAHFCRPMLITAAELLRLRHASAVLAKLVEDGWVKQSDVDDVAADLTETSERG